MSGAGSNSSGLNGPIRRRGGCRRTPGFRFVSDGFDDDKVSMTLDVASRLDSGLSSFVSVVTGGSEKVVGVENFLREIAWLPKMILVLQSGHILCSPHLESNCCILGTFCPTRAAGVAVAADGEVFCSKETNSGKVD